MKEEPEQAGESSAQAELVSITEPAI